jgi:hypothetical protein
MRSPPCSGASSSCRLSSRAGVVFALNYWNLRTKHPGGSRSPGSPARARGAGFSGHATGGSLIGANLAGFSISTGPDRTLVGTRPQKTENQFDRTIADRRRPVLSACIREDDETSCPTSARRERSGNRLTLSGRMVTIPRGKTVQRDGR